MKKLFLVAMGIVFSASMASAFDIKGQTLGVAGDLMSGKSAKEIAEEKKKEAEEAAKAELNKQTDKALNKLDDKTGGAASMAGGLLKK